MTALACARAVSNAFHESAVYFDPSSFSASTFLTALSSAALSTVPGSGFGSGLTSPFSVSPSRAEVRAPRAASTSCWVAESLAMTALACARAVSNAFHESTVYFDPSSFSASIALIFLSSSDLLTGAGSGVFSVSPA